ncbi:MAG: hypothetical protein Q8L27_00760 [archaeon]|nr:hypothetical protein [archaeon]
MKNQIKNNKAEISVTTLITVIILVLSFVIILFLWYQFFWEGNIDRETCHTSVILKKTIPDKSFILGGGKIVELPLRCKTEKICLTSGFNDKGCSDIGSKYQKISVSTEEDIIEIIADNLVACWGMMGESRDAAIFSRELKLVGSSKGVICSIIDFSPDTKSKIETLDYKKFNDYLYKNKFSDGTQTYAEFLLGSRNSIGKTGGTLEGSFALNRPIANIFIETRTGTLNAWVGGAGGAILTGALFVAAAPIVGTAVAVGTGIVAVGAAGYGVGSLADDWNTFINGNEETKADFYSAIILRYYDVNELRNLNIDSFENLA